MKVITAMLLRAALYANVILTVISVAQGTMFAYIVATASWSAFVLAHGARWESRKA